MNLFLKQGRMTSNQSVNGLCCKRYNIISSYLNIKLGNQIYDNTLQSHFCDSCQSVRLLLFDDKYPHALSDWACDGFKFSWEFSESQIIYAH